MSAPVTSHLIAGWHSGARPKGQDLFRVLLNFQSGGGKKNVTALTHVSLAEFCIIIDYIMRDSHLNWTKTLAEDHLMIR